MPAWSQQIETKYQLALPPDVRHWLDDEVWRDPGGAEFTQGVAPAELLEPHAELIWPGFMLPDTLPLVGNNYGDWLCLRIAADGSVAELLYWYHGGGDWTPYGRSLSEALLYDAAFRVMYGRRPEFTHPEPPPDELFRAAAWAASQLRDGGRPAPPEFWEQPADAGHLLHQLLSCDVAAIATRRDLILRSLQSGLRQHSRQEVADNVGAAWLPDFVSWLFDARLIPGLAKDQLCELLHVQADALTRQDWQAAERHALTVAQQRTDLAWALDVAGWAAERRGDQAAAINIYQQGLQASVFGDDAIRFRTHWFADGFGKFSAFRLHALRDRLTDSWRRDPYLNLLWSNEPDSLRQRAADHWRQTARQCSQEGRHAEAYRAYYRAGWDFGLPRLDQYAELLAQLAESARDAQSPALAAVAAEHLRLAVGD